MTEEKQTKKIKKNEEKVDESKEIKEEEGKKVEETKSEQEKKKENKKPQQKVKKTEATVDVKSIQGSVKTASDICRMIRYKPLDLALENLELVIKQKKAVPMRGEIPHRKGEIMAGRFPKKLAKQFSILIKSLKANAENHDVEDPIIVEAIVNKAYLPFGKMGRVRRKRFHIKLKAMERKLWYGKKKKVGGKK